MGATEGLEADDGKLAAARKLVVAVAFKKTTNEPGMSMKTKERFGCFLPTDFEIGDRFCPRRRMGT
jgi:hypothetical protein